MTKAKKKKIKTPSRDFFIGGAIFKHGQELTEKEIKLFDGKKYTTVEIEIQVKEEE